MNLATNGVGTEEETVDTGRYLGVLLSRWWLLLLGPAVAGVVAWTYSDRQTPVYEATTTIQVQQVQGGTGIASLGDIQTSRTLAVTYKELITTRPVMEGVVEELGLRMGPNALAGAISIQIVSGTELLRIRVHDSDPVQAALIADTTAVVFKRQTEENRLADIARLQQVAIVQGGSNVQDFVTAQLNALGSILIVENAEPSSSPIAPRTRLNIILAVVLGIMFSVVVAFVLEYLQDSVQTPERLEKRFGLTNLGAVPFWKPKEIETHELVMEKLPKSGYSEAYRNLRANLQFVNATGPIDTMVVSSPWPGEGKSTVVSNLAAAFAQDGKSVVVVDADFRRPTMHRFFSVGRTIGLSNFLADPKVELDSIIQKTSINGVDIITSGPKPPNPSELLGAPRMHVLLENLKERVDIVLFDTPPFIGMADSVKLATMVGGLILVVNPGTSMGLINKALESIRMARVNLIGHVVNKFTISRFRYGYYKYSYYHYYNYTY